MRKAKIERLLKLLVEENQPMANTPIFFSDEKGTIYKGKHYKSPDDLKKDYPKVVYINFK